MYEGMHKKLILMRSLYIGLGEIVESGEKGCMREGLRMTRKNS